MENLKAVLEAGGSSMDDVLKTTCFLTNMDDFAAFNEVYARYFPGRRPARSAFEVSRLNSSYVVEVEAIAEATEVRR
jgi:2-iminobutanoate/2-iminopropanoate deaminase